MAKEIKKNKINERQKRRAENIRENLVDQGFGEDDAQRRAIEEAVEEIEGGRGGGTHSGGEPKKKGRHGGHRPGSESNESK